MSTAEGSDDLIEAMPDVDILIDNAAALGPQPFAETRDAEWTRFFETNVMSGVRLSRHCLPGMLTRNSGRILFVSSESVFQRHRLVGATSWGHFPAVAEPESLANVIRQFFRPLC